MASSFRSVTGKLSSEINQNIVFVDSDEVLKKANIARGLNKPGWYRHFEIRHPDGTVSYANEILYLTNERVLNIDEAKEDDVIVADDNHGISLATTPKNIRYYFNNENPSSYVWQDSSNQLEVQLVTLEEDGSLSSIVPTSIIDNGETLALSSDGSFILLTHNTDANKNRIVEWQYTLLEKVNDEDYKVIKSTDEYVTDLNFGYSSFLNDDEFNNLDFNVDTKTLENNYEYKVLIKNDIGSETLESDTFSIVKATNSIWIMNGMVVIPSYTNFDQIVWKANWELVNNNSSNENELDSRVAITLELRPNADSEWYSQSTHYYDEIDYTKDESMDATIREAGDPPQEISYDRGSEYDLYDNVNYPNQLTISNTQENSGEFSEWQYRFHIQEYNFDEVPAIGGQDYYSNPEYIRMEVEKIRLIPNINLERTPGPPSLNTNNGEIKLEDTSYLILNVLDVEDQVGLNRDTDSEIQYTWSHKAAGDGPVIEVNDDRKVGETGDPGYDSYVAQNNLNTFYISTNRESGAEIRLKLQYGDDVNETEIVETEPYTMIINHEIHITNEDYDFDQSPIIYNYITNTPQTQSFDASVQYGNLQYQWQMRPTTHSGTTTFANFTDIPNATSNTTNLTKNQLEETYRNLAGDGNFLGEFLLKCNVTDATYAPDVMTRERRLRINHPVSISIDPPDRLIDESAQSIRASVTSDFGSSYRYSWQYRDISTNPNNSYNNYTPNGNVVNSLTRNSLRNASGIANNAHTIEFKINVGSDYDNDREQTVEIKIDHPITIDTQPIVPTARKGLLSDTAQTITMDASGGRTDVTGIDMVYKWFITDTRLGNRNFQELSGQTSSSLPLTTDIARSASSVSNNANTIYLQGQASSEFGNPVDSDVITINIDQPITATLSVDGGHTGFTTNEDGNLTPAAINIRTSGIVANGATYTYNWQVTDNNNPSETDWIDLNGTTSSIGYDANGVRNMEGIADDATLIKVRCQITSTLAINDAAPSIDLTYS